MVEAPEQDGLRIEILSDADLGVPARVLDLFTAQSHLPRVFAFRRADDGLRLQIVVGVMSPGRRAILRAKLDCIAGVRCVSEQPAGLALVYAP